MFKYYKIKKGLNLPQIDGIEIYDYHEIDGNKIIGVDAENHSEFESLIKAEELSFEEVEHILIECHFYKELDREKDTKISNANKIKYGLKQ